MNCQTAADTTSQHDADYVPIRTAARLTGISRELISRAISRGEIPAFRPGKRWVYVRIEDVRTWLGDQAITPSHQHVVERVDRSIRRARVHARRKRQENINEED